MRRTRRPSRGDRAVLREALLRSGLAPGAIMECLDETEAARLILSRAGPGDSLVLPVHGAGNRARVVALLDQLQADGWSPGGPLPASTSES